MNVKRRFSRRLLGLSILVAIFGTFGATSASALDVDGLSTALDDNDFMGQSVDVDGTYAVVGVPGHNNDAGLAVVYRDIGNGVWQTVADLVGPQGYSGTRFGERVAIDGSTVVVGTGGATIGSNINQGAAYVFEVSSSGAVFKARLLASDGAAQDRFGHAVDVDGDTVVVGAPLADHETYGANRGRTYVFVRPGAGWSGTMTQAGKLEFFGNCGLAGWDVAIDGDSILTGIPGECTSGPNRGAAAIFLKGAAWSNRSIETAMLRPLVDSAGNGATSGSSVAIDGDEAVIGGPGYSQGSGRAFVFTKPATGWQNTVFSAAWLQAGDAAAGDDFGREVGMQNGGVVVGAPLKDAFTHVDRGSVYSYRRPAAGWSGIVTHARHDSHGGPGDRFGESVTFANGLTIIGAPYADSELCTDCGTAYLFDLPLVSADFPSASEGSVATFAITIPEPQMTPVSVDVRTQDETAVSTSDYQARTKTTVTIPAGATAATFEVQTVDDATDEPNETFRLLLSDPSGAYIAQPAGSWATVNDGDLAYVSVDDAIATEGGGLNFSISVAEPAGEAVNVGYYAGAIGDTAQAGSDFQTTSGQAQIPAGQRSVGVTVPTIDDSLVEGDEHVTFSVSTVSGNATFGDAVGAGKIKDNDTYPKLSITDRSKPEGNSGLQNFNFTVKLSKPFAEAVTVKYSTAVPSSRAASTTNDYIALTDQPLTFASGETAKKITVQVRGDKKVEPDEKFRVVLSAPVNATIDDGTGVGTIENDD